MGLICAFKKDNSAVFFSDSTSKAHFSVFVSRRVIASAELNTHTNTKRTKPPICLELLFTPTVLKKALFRRAHSAGTKPAGFINSRCIN
jgi:hypothetical protein